MGTGFGLGAVDKAAEIKRSEVETDVGGPFLIVGFALEARDGWKKHEASRART